MSTHNVPSPEISIHCWQGELTEQAGCSPLTHQSLFLGCLEGLKLKDNTTFYYDDLPVYKAVGYWKGTNLIQVLFFWFFIQDWN